MTETTTRYRPDRLQKLADFLRTVPKAKFDFATILREGENTPLIALSMGEYDCGTAACAIGWMPAAFPRSIKWSDAYSSYGGRKAREIIPVSCPSNNHRGVDSFKTASEFFGLTIDECGSLFTPEEPMTVYIKRAGEHKYFDGSVAMHDATAKQVARRIETFIARRAHLNSNKS